jgi:hypothetical protein
MSDNPAPHGDAPNPDRASPPIASSPIARPATVDDIRKQVETEQALSNALKRVEQLESEIKKVTEEKEAIATEKDGSSERSRNNTAFQTS